jgi:WhiB family redox-sensing transcriptional regulator
VTSATSRNLPPVRDGILPPAAYRPSIQWQESAVCRHADPELFFPIGSAGKAAAEIEQAKAICASCPVHRPCLTYALATSQEFGIWGGHDEKERRRLHRQWRGLVAESRPLPDPASGGERISSLPALEFPGLDQLTGDLGELYVLGLGHA